jgi:hypothetical protein
VCTFGVASVFHQSCGQFIWANLALAGHVRLHLFTFVLWFCMLCVHAVGCCVVLLALVEMLPGASSSCGQFIWAKEGMCGFYRCGCIFSSILVRHAVRAC